MYLSSHVRANIRGTQILQILEQADSALFEKSTFSTVKDFI